MALSILGILLSQGCDTRRSGTDGLRPLHSQRLPSPATLTHVRKAPAVHPRFWDRLPECIADLSPFHQIPSRNDYACMTFVFHGLRRRRSSVK